MLLKIGIKRELSCAHTPQQNGVSERKNRHLVESCRAMLQAKGVPRIYWGECIRTAAYFHNKTPSSAISNKTLYEMLHKKVPDVGHLQVFGCVCYVHLPEPSKGKLDKKAVRSNACSLDTPLRGKGGGVLSLRQEGCTSPVTSCSTKEPVGVGSQQREGTYINQQPQFDRNVGGRTAKGNGRRSFRNHVRRGCDALLIYTGRRCYDVMPSSSSASAQQSSSHTQGDRERGPWRTGVHVEGAERPVPRTCEERQKKTGVVQEAAPQGSSTSPVEPAGRD